MPLIVIAARFVVGAEVNNRNGREPTIATGLDPGFVHPPDRASVSDRAR